MKIIIVKNISSWSLEVVASNGTTMLTSKTYTRKRNAKEAAKLLKAKLGKAKIVEAQ
jgi:uncharacterized protein YegP (UPF0339 family)